ncbi:MAG TPA: nucleotide exchange factor GrpE [Polyangiaceae bacterium]|nr:nucleotide exchange factor GrpE [Polyangiaceae bacterium]
MVSEDVTEPKADAPNRRSEEPEAASEEATSTEAASEATGGSAEAETDAGDPLAEALEEVKRIRDQLLRTAADFDNFRKRSRREVSEAGERGREEILKELLPVFDNLERAADHAKGATEVSALIDGIDLVIKQFVDTLGKIGVEKLDARGQAFDPSVHEAIQQLETDEVAPGSVAYQVQPGYKMGGRLVRPCMVVVAKAPTVQ